MNRIALIKIDAEGHEPIIFKGIEKLVSRDKPVLIVETVDESIRQLLSTLGYKETKLENSPNIIFDAR